MYIWLLTHFYPPEFGASPVRLSRLVRLLTADGHKVTVITGLPNYPEGIIKEPYRGRVLYKEVADGAQIYRLWVYASPSKGTKARLANQLSLTISAALVGTFLKAPDVILVESHPLPICLAGNWLHFAKRRPMVLNVSDLWPESAIAVGALNPHSKLVKIARWVERWTYQQAAHIVGMTQGVVDGILKVNRRSERVTLLQNGVDLEKFRPGLNIERKQIRSLYNLEGSFVVVHIGNMSLTYDFQTILESAALAPELRFVFVGGGSQEESIRQGIASRGLTNVKLLGILPHSDMPAIWAAADACVIALGDHSVAAGTLPAKMYEALSTGTPVIAAIRGEGAALLENTKAGVVVPIGDSQAMAQALKALALNPEKQTEMQRAGRTYAEEKLSPQRVKNAFVEIFESVTKERVQGAQNG
jgi:glycosyltransferase involved in cell wall biosynthesis